MTNTIVSVVPCSQYHLDSVRQAVIASLEPLGGIRRFVKPGMTVLLKPNLLLAADVEQAVTTHPLIVQVVAEMVRDCGAKVLIGDSPAAPPSTISHVWEKCGMQAAAEQTGTQLIPFDSIIWKNHNGSNYFLARPVTEVDLMINLPKLKTHSLALYTGAVKNLYGTISGTHKREIHVRAPSLADFSRELVNILELVKPGLTIMDGILGQEGNGPGPGGTPHRYNCIAASTDPIALDTVISNAMGFRNGEVIYLGLGAERGLGTASLNEISLISQPGTLNFGKLNLPSNRLKFHVPGWISSSIENNVKLHPEVRADQCVGCGKCEEVCAGDAITTAQPIQIDLERCVGCMCCSEVCPQGAISTHRSLLARMIGIGS